MDKLPPFGREVRDIIGPTKGTFEPLLLKNADEIRSVPKQTFTYGNTERQKLDVYSSPKPSLKNGRMPVMMFLYGGGFVLGDRTLPDFADGLCHANIAAFFALRCGYTTIIPDYRISTQKARFPSGGEDVALAVEWVINHAQEISSEPIDLFIMGNSVGGVHLSTFLLHPQFTDVRQKVITGDQVRLRGAVLLAVLFHFGFAPPARQEVYETYFGDVEANAPLGLLKTARENGTIDFLTNKFQMLLLAGELDLEDDILATRDDFVREWMSLDDSKTRVALSSGTLVGHNHISPFCSLGTGLEREEAWGQQVAAFCDGVRTFPV